MTAAHVGDDASSGVAMRKSLIERGWRQGSFVPSELFPSIAHIDEPDPEVAAYYVVVSADCDLLHHSAEEEPIVEVARLEVIAEVDPAYESNRNPREIHLRIDADGRGETACRVLARQRGWLRRSLLLDQLPDTACSITEGTLGKLVSFFARRYDRETLPDEFNRRFDPARAQLLRIAKRNADAILDILLKIDPFSELGENESYAVAVFVLLDDASAYGPTSKGLKSRLGWEIRQALRKCSGIVTDTALAVGLGEITLEQADGLHPLDLEPVK